MKYWTSVILRGAAYTLMLILSCGLLFGCQDQTEAGVPEPSSAVYESCM